MNVFSYSPNNLNQYTSVGGISYGYDGNGNLISGNGTFIYDAQNRLLTAEVGANTDQYSYDSKNRVVEREINGTPTFFIYDGWNLIEERDSSGDVLATYVMGVRQDEIVSKTTPSGTVYYHHNALGSVIALTNPSGTVVENYKYDVYGKASITDGSGSPLSASAYGNRFMFTGREYLAEVNLYDYRNRVYSADLGRFLQTDPMRFDAGDVNIYRYCGNNPLNSTDLTGLINWGTTLTGIGQISLGAAGLVGLAGLEAGSGGLATGIAIGGGLLSAGSIADGWANLVGGLAANSDPVNAPVGPGALAAAVYDGQVGGPSQADGDMVDALLGLSGDFYSAAGEDGSLADLGSAMVDYASLIQAFLDSLNDDQDGSCGGE